MLRVGRVDQGRTGSGGGSSTTMSPVWPTKSDTPRSCSVRPNSEPTLPRSRTRASMNRSKSCRPEIPEGRAHDAFLDGHVHEQRADLRIRGTPGPLHDAGDFDVVAVVPAAQHRAEGDRLGAGQRRLPETAHDLRVDVRSKPAAYRCGLRFRRGRRAAARARPPSAPGSVGGMKNCPSWPSWTIRLTSACSSMWVTMPRTRTG